MVQFLDSAGRQGRGLEAEGEGLDEVAALVEAGADFVALGTFVLSDPAGAPALIRAAADTLIAEPTR